MIADGSSRLRDVVHRYRVVHRTTYRYPESVAICRNQIRVTPRRITHGTTEVRPQTVQLSIAPEPTSRNAFTDYFGNTVTHFSIERPHDHLAIQSQFDVTLHVDSVGVDSVGADALTVASLNRWLDDSPDARRVEIDEFRRDSPRVQSVDTIDSDARLVVDPAADVRDAAMAVTRWLHERMTYDPSATDVSTPPATAHATGRGVCQDFAHIAVAMMRSVGVPSRYVSGYLRTVPPPGRPRLVGADQSHAWFGVFAGPGAGWIDFDPTNGCIAGTDHIPIAVGRDYGDVAPVRGIVLGGGRATLGVSVDVAPVVVERVGKT